MRIGPIRIPVVIKLTLPPFAVLLLCAAFLSGGAALADVTRMEDLPKGESGAAYKRATRFSGIRNEAFYVDQVNGEIPMDQAPRYRKAEDETNDDGGGLSQTTIQFASVGLLIAIGFLFWKFGGSSQISLRRGDASGATAQTSEVAAAAEYENVKGADFLRMIAEMPDRRHALILLVGRVLLRAADSNGLRLKRSETAREILRRIPRSWSHFTELKSLVLSEELVQFGGRDISEESFESCLEKARPMIAGARA